MHRVAKMLWLQQVTTEHRHIICGVQKQNEKQTQTKLWMVSSGILVSNGMLVSSGILVSNGMLVGSGMLVDSILLINISMFSEVVDSCLYIRLIQLCS